MGIRKRIIIGFVSLAVLLFFSGVVSLVELRRLSGQTAELVEAGARDMGYSRDMLDALQQQAILFIDGGYLVNLDPHTGRVVDDNRALVDSILTASDKRFNGALASAAATARDMGDIAAIYGAQKEYAGVVETFFAGGPVDHLALSYRYRRVYFALTSAIKDYMTSSQEIIRENISRVGDTAYRAITPGILALGVGIVVLLVFLYLIDIYFARPMVAINRSLRGYLASRLPFQVKTEARDEVLELKEGIDDLIALNRKKQE